MNTENNVALQYKTIWYLLFLVALITLYPFLEIGITNGDDLMYYDLSFHKDLWPMAFDFAKDSGRFYFALINPVYTFPYSFDNFAITKTLQYTALLSNFLLFTLVLRKAFKSPEFALLSLTLLLSTLSLSKWTSLIVCYPFCFSFSFTLILSSVYLLLFYLENEKTKTLLLSAILYSIGLLFYEVYFIYFLIVAIIVIVHYGESFKTNHKKILRTLLPYVIVGVTYLTVYITFYLVYPTNYDGNSISGNITLKSAFSILKNYPESAFPLSVFYQNQPIFQYQSDLISGHQNNFWYILTNSKVEWLIRAGLICLIIILIRKRLPKLNFKATITGVIISIILIYLSHILLTITKKYNVDYPELKGYIPTYYSYFGVILLLTLACSLIYTFAKRNKLSEFLYITVLLGVIFVWSVKTSYSNYYTAKDMAQAKLPFDLLDDFFEWKEFNNIPDSSIVYAKDLWQSSSTQAILFNQGFNWEAHIYNKTKKLLHTASSEETFYELKKNNLTSPCFIIKKQEATKTKEAFMLLAPIVLSKDDSILFYANKVTLLYYSTYKEFSVSFRLREDTPKENTVAIGSFRDSIHNNYYSININGSNKQASSTIITFNASNIDLNSFIVSNIRQPNRPTIEVSE